MKLLKAIAKGFWDLIAWMWRRRGGRSVLIIFLLALAAYFIYGFGYPGFFRWYTGDKIREPYYPNSRPVSDGEFEEIAREILTDFMLPEAMKAAEDVLDPTTREDRVRLLLRTRSFVDRSCFRHIEVFRKHGIRQYKGPETCLQCHPDMNILTDDGYKTVDTMEDVLDTVHFRLFMTTSGFSTYGYNGEKVNSGWYKIPVGKIDRACGIPGSFTWTGWSERSVSWSQNGSRPSQPRAALRASMVAVLSEPSRFSK